MVGLAGHFLFLVLGFTPTGRDTDADEVAHTDAVTAADMHTDVDQHAGTDAGMNTK